MYRHINLHEEVLLNNVIEKDLQSVLRPLNFIQHCFICSKYTIRDNFITSNSLKYNLFGLICALFYRGCLLYDFGFIAYLNWYTFLITLFLRVGYQNLTLAIGYLLHFVCNILYGNDNVVLIVNVQNLIRTFKLERKHLKCFIIFNWFWVLFLNIVFISQNFRHFIIIDLKNFNIHDVIGYIPSILLDINIVYAIFFINLLKKLLTVMIEELVRSTVRVINTRRRSHWTEFYNSFAKILETYELFQKTFRLLVSFVIFFFNCISR